MGEGKGWLGTGNGGLLCRFVEIHSCLVCVDSLMCFVLLGETR